ncbi:hypothetical protein PtB15_8B24 [Puccinia triticina]|nr:hypothetical protein PtB15_8B24 [Puccinia triticina]
MSSQPAPASKGAQQGYASDASEGQTRRSSRITTPVKRSGMVPASTDSRRSIVFPTAIPNNPSKKRVHSSSKATSEANSTITKAKSQKKSRSNKKSGEPTLINADGKSSIEIIDYAQNSDEDNAKVHNPAKKKNNKFDEIMLFFKALVYIQTDSEELEEDVVNESEIDEDDDFSSRSESEEENTDPTDDENHNSSKKRKTKGKKRGTTRNKANELDELTKSLAILKQ